MFWERFWNHSVANEYKSQVKVLACPSLIGWGYFPNFALGLSPALGTHGYQQIIVHVFGSEIEKAQMPIKPACGFL